MHNRVLRVGRTSVIAAALALVGFGAAGYGVFGSVAVTDAILETTSQSPLDVPPRPSFVAVAPPAGTSAETAATPAAPANAADREPLVAVTLIAIALAAGVTVWRRTRTT